MDSSGSCSDLSVFTVEWVGAIGVHAESHPDPSGPGNRVQSWRPAKAVHHCRALRADVWVHQNVVFPLNSYLFGTMRKYKANRLDPPLICIQAHATSAGLYRAVSPGLDPLSPLRLQG